MRLADVNIGLLDDRNQTFGLDALGGFDIFELLLNGLSIDRGVALGARLLGAFELSEQEFDPLNHRLELFEILFVNLELEV